MNKSTAKPFSRALVAVACTAALGWAATYKWTGAGANNNWDTSDNCRLASGQPSFTNYPGPGDDATIPTDGSPWPIDLITVSMDDLTILEDVNFDTAGGTTTLTVESLIIDGSSNAITVTITSSTTIRNTVP